nr:YabP/YqfC family sporulation protein [uncultured Blautia sp.]
MQKRYQWKDNLLSALEVPGDLAEKETVVTITGKNQAVIENYKSLLHYTKEEIIILTFRGKITLQGSNLEIPWYTTEEMRVSGRFFLIILEQQEAKNE